jgi:hypothetical protein
LILTFRNILRLFNFERLDGESNFWVMTNTIVSYFLIEWYVTGTKDTKIKQFVQTLLITMLGFGWRTGSFKLYDFENSSLTINVLWSSVGSIAVYLLLKIRKRANQDLFL